MKKTKRRTKKVKRRLTVYKTISQKIKPKRSLVALYPKVMFYNNDKNVLRCTCQY